MLIDIGYRQHVDVLDIVSVVNPLLDVARELEVPPSEVERRIREGELSIFPTVVTVVRGNHVARYGSPYQPEEVVEKIHQVLGIAVDEEDQPGGAADGTIRHEPYGGSPQDREADKHYLSELKAQEKSSASHGTQRQTQKRRS